MDVCNKELQNEVKKRKCEWEDEVVGVAGATPGEAFLLMPNAGSPDDSLSLYSGKRLLGRRSSTGARGHSGRFFRLPNRPVENSKVSAPRS